VLFFNFQLLKLTHILHWSFPCYRHTHPLQ